MANGQRTYREMVAEARRQAMQGANGLPAQALKTLREEYATMLLEITQDVEAGRITQARADELRDQIDSALRRLTSRFPRALENARDEAIAAGVRAHREAAKELVSRSNASVAVAERFATVPEEVVEMAMRRRGLGGSTTMKTLVRRNVEEAAGSIDRAITSALGRGESQQRLTKRIAGHLARGDEELLDVLRRRGKAGRDLAEDIASTELTSEELGRSKRLLYDARRIAVSEISNHYDETEAVSMARSPVVDLVSWNTSAQHPNLDSSPDMCDGFEEYDPHGYGQGLYHPRTVPARPHPHCQCPKLAVTHEPQNFGTERPVPEKPEVGEGQLRDIMKRHERDAGRSVTDKYVKNQRRQMQRTINAIYNAPR